MTTLTKELIDDCETENGGMTYSTILALTGKQNPGKGWRTSLVGCEISSSDYKKAFLGKTKFSAMTMKMQKGKLKKFKSYDKTQDDLSYEMNLLRRENKRLNDKIADIELSIKLIQEEIM